MSARCIAVRSCYVRDGVIEDIKPNPAHPLSKGAFCIKGLKGPTGLTYSEKRLLHPLRRVGERGEGKWERISWDDGVGPCRRPLRRGA